MKYTVEIPHYPGSLKTMGGMVRLMRLVNDLTTVELPHYRPHTGGIKDTVTLVQLYGPPVHLRIQKTYPHINYATVEFGVPYSVGLPDNTFPESKYVITYSDTPYGRELTGLPQIGKAAIYMLSYGMAIERERANVLNPKFTVMTTTKRTKQLIEAEGVRCHQVGFGLNTEDFYIDSDIKRKTYAALLYHWAPDKRYALGVDIVDQLCDMNKIEGVITFGANLAYDKARHPKKLIKHYSEATSIQVREVFNQCSVFIMPSVSEGLSLTPFEATLCGCPSMLCDGALGDLYFPEANCKWVQKDNKQAFLRAAEDILSHDYSQLYRQDMIERCRPFTWANTVANIKEVLET